MKRSVLEGVMFFGVFLTSLAHADGVYPTGFPGTNYSESYASGISADGLHAIGFGKNDLNIFQGSVFNFDGSTSNVLLFSTPSRLTIPSAINANGTVIVGYYDDGAGGPGFRWVKDNSGSPSGGTFTQLSYLPGGVGGAAQGINYAGDVMVGKSYDGVRDVAVRWVDNNAGGFAITSLGYLSGGNESFALGASALGDVVIGASQNNFSQFEAFRWQLDSSGSPSGGTMRGLGFLGSDTTSYAYGINANGNVVIGESISGSGSQAFRWVMDNPSASSQGTMYGLGFLPGGTTSTASAVNAAGDVVVGRSLVASNQIAFRWTLTGGMQSVESWLSQSNIQIAGFTRLAEAYGVSADGKTVVGKAVDSNGNSEGFIARVTANPADSGIVGTTDLANSISQTLAVSSQMDNLTGTMLNGAHHRTLMDSAIGDGDNCGWVNGDVGRVYRQANGYIGMAEVGACHHLADDAVMVGVGIGSSHADLDLANDGHSRLNGTYGIAEIDWRLPNTSFVASLLGSYGQWDANLKRGYTISGTQPSTGSTDVSVYSLRSRIDWENAFYFGKIGFTPRLAYTVSRSEVDGYQEKGGSAPASFGDQNHTSQEARLGLTGKYSLNEKVTLFGHSEAVHRFDRHGANYQANINVLGINIDQNLNGNPVQQDWVRIGAEIDYKINASNVLNASSFIATAGQDADITAAMSWKFLF